MTFSVGDKVTSTNANDTWRQHGDGQVIDISGDYNMNKDYPIAVAFSDASLILRYQEDGTPIYVSAFYTTEGAGADGDTITLDS